MEQGGDRCRVERRELLVRDSGQDQSRCIVWQAREDSGVQLADARRGILLQAEGARKTKAGKGREEDIDARAVGRVIARRAGTRCKLGKNHACCHFVFDILGVSRQ